MSMHNFLSVIYYIFTIFFGMNVLNNIISNFEQLPVNLSCKLFDTLIRSILSYNCEIWYMDEYLPLYRAMLRATRNNTFCDTLVLQEKSTFEKIHTKYCKTVLGLKKTACNISTLSELGRLPIASFIKTQVMMYFVRINTNNINPLIKESLNIDKSLHDEGFYTWYTLALSIFQEFDLDAEDFSNMDKCFHKIKVPFKKEFKKVAHNNYIQKTKNKLSKLTDNSKLYLYNKIKHDIVLEEYLIQEFFKKNRQLNQQPRNLVINTIENKCPSFTDMSPMN